MDERIIKYFNDELSESERIKLLKDSEINPELRKDLLSGQNITAILSLSTEAIDDKAGHENYRRLSKLKQRNKAKKYILRATGYAAAVALLIATTWIIAVSDKKEITQIAQQQELYVPPGQRARLTLPDGSSVWLNAGSTLRYLSAFGDERVVNLTGEAYFDVAHNPEKPFIVSTDSLQIKVLGTQFNIQSYPEAEYISTSVLHGSVKVYKPGKESEGKVMNPNQQLFYEKGVFRLEELTDKDKLLWKEGIYSFRKERLDQIIKKLELYYDIEITVKDPRILQYEYTGKFRQRDGVLEILRIIQKIHPFKIDKDEELNKITLSR